MLIEVCQKQLADVLHRLSTVVSARNVIPVLSGIYVQADSGGVTLTAGHIGLLLQYLIPPDKDHAVIRQKGSTVIPARYFIDIIRNLPPGTVLLESKEDLSITIRSGKAVYRLRGMDAEHYPRIAYRNPSETIRLQNGSLKKMIKQICFAVSSSESKPVLTGVSCQFDHGHVRLLATDGVRLAARTGAIENPSRMSIPEVIIPGKHLAEYAKLLGDDEHVMTEISISKQTILFKTKNVLMQSSLLEGIYPPTDKLIPEAFTTEITFESVSLLRALERAALLAGDNNVIKLHITMHQTIELSSRTADIGDVVEEIGFEALSGEPVTIYFNGKFMVDMMRAVDCHQVRLGISGKWNPIIVQPSDSPSSLYILTPIRSHQ